MLNLLIFWFLSFSFTSAGRLEPTVRDVWPRLALRGDTLTISGDRFADSPQLQCRLESTATQLSERIQRVDAAVYISPTRVICRVPHDVALTTYIVSVSNDGVRFVAAPASLSVVTHRPSAASTDDADDKNRNFDEPDLILAGWSPLRAPAGATLQLRVRSSSHAMRLPQLRCRFGDVDVAALELLNAHEFRCVIPPQAPALVAQAASANVPLAVELAVSIDAGSHWSSHSARFVYDAVDEAAGAAASVAPRLDSFYPTVAAWGATVTAYGDRFVTSDEHKNVRPLCRFDKTVVPAVVQRSSVLTCVVPRHSGGLFSFQVSNDGVQWSASGKFRIEAAATPPTVTELHPAHGLPGTLVSVFGEDFEDSEYLACRFGTKHHSVVRASFVSPTSVQCEVPVLKAREVVPLQVSNNGEAWSELRATPLLFTVDTTIGHGGGDDDALLGDVNFAEADGALVHARIMSLAPRRGPSGTTVVLSGVDFDAQRHYRCRFGSAVVQAVYVSPQRIECDAPLRAFPGPVFVSIADNDRGVFDDASQLSFEYVRGLAVPLIYAVAPTTASISSNVTVFGRRFVASSNLCCMFGMFRSHATLVDAATASADVRLPQQRTSTALQCVVPRQLRSGESVDLRIANNGCVELARGASGSDDDEHQRVISHDFKTVLIAHSVPVIDTVEPRVPSRGALIVLRGRGFEPGDLAACRFGDSLSSPMRYMNDESAMCTVPHTLPVPADVDKSNPLGAFGVLLTATNDGLSWSVTPYSMRVRTHGILPIIKAIWPLVGERGTLVTVSGEHMTAIDAAQVRCRFGQAVVMPVSVANAATRGIDCVAPPRSAAFGIVAESAESLRQPLTVELSVSFDGGREWASAAAARFTFASEHGSLGGALWLAGSVLLAMFGVPALFVAFIMRAQRNRSPWLTKLLQRIVVQTSGGRTTKQK